MKSIHHFVSSLLVVALTVAPPQGVSAVQFYHKTEKYYSPDQDHDIACKAEFGETGARADFSNFKRMTEPMAKAMIAEMQIKPSRNANYYFVTYGQHQVMTGTRKEAFFFEYHPKLLRGKAISYFDLIDEHAGMKLSATHHYGQVICVTGTAEQRKLFETLELDEDAYEAQAKKYIASVEEHHHHHAATAAKKPEQPNSINNNNNNSNEPNNFGRKLKDSFGNWWA